MIVPFVVATLASVLVGILCFGFVVHLLVVTPDAKMDGPRPLWSFLAVVYLATGLTVGSGFIAFALSRSLLLG